MNLKPLASKLKKAAPIILSALSVIGVVGTAILSAKATAKALEQVDERDDTWKCYIPTALVVLATAMCIIGNGVINRKNQASLLAAYAVLERSYRQYRDKVKEICGEEVHKKIICETHSDLPVKVEKAKPVPINSPCLLSDNCLDWDVDDMETPHLFCEAFSGRYFESNIHRVMQAEMAVCRNFSLGGFVTVNDFYEFLGIEPFEGGDEIGWCLCDGINAMEFNHYKTTIDDGSEDGLDVLVIDFDFTPRTEGEWFE